MAEFAPSSLARLATRSIRCRCPRCGEGKLYAGFLTLVEHCSHCNLTLAMNDNGDGPAVFLIFILGFGLVPTALYIAMHVDWPLWLHAVLWSGVVLGATIGLLRPAKALTLALQYSHRPETFKNDIQE